MRVSVSCSARASTTCANARKRVVRLAARVLHVEAVRGDDLVVARAARMDLAADGPEQALDRAVHVLVGRLEVGRLDLVEPLLGVGELVGREEARLVEPPRVQARALDVVREELVVLRLDERPHLGRELGLADAARPERAQIDHPSFSSIARASVMSLIFTCSCPIRSAAPNAVSLRSIDRRSGPYERPSPRVSRIV